MKQSRIIQEPTKMSIRPLSKELQKKANDELFEVESRIPADIAYIKNWLKQSPYLKVRTDDQWLLTFLRGCKFSLERTKEKLDTYYTMRSLVPEIFQNRDPMQPEIQKILKLGVFLPLPIDMGPDSPKILLIRNGFYEASDIDHATLFKTNMLIQDILLNEDDQYTVCGGIMIQDMKSITMAHMPPPSLMKKAMALFQEAYPIRPKGSHFINTPTFFEVIYGIVKPFLNEKMKSRMVVHTSDNLENLYKIVPKDKLPKEYGGDGPSLDEITEFWKKKVESYRDWFLEDSKYGTDEKMRPGKPKIADELFGIEGSFRKLNVD